MNRPITHLVINDIRIDEDVILVGATDNERWRWDQEDEVETGANAKTLVWVEIHKNRNGSFFYEKAGFHSNPGDPTRTIAMTSMLELFEVAWSIANEKFDQKTARSKFFGKEIKKTDNTV